MASESTFKEYGHYYDLLYGDKEYDAEVDYIDGLLKRYEIAGPELLEFGSGTGKHGRLLAERGYHVVGVERSAEMVALAAETGGFTCQLGDVCSIHLGRTFDAVLALFHVVSYQVSNDALRSLFDRASEHLGSGGLFVFDIWYSPAVYFQRPEVRVKRVADSDVSITRIAEPEIFPNENRVDVNYTIFAEDRKTGAVNQLTENHPMRHFSLPELVLLAESSNFKHIAAEEFLSSNEPSERTWGVCVVLQKV